MFAHCADIESVRIEKDDNSTSDRDECQHILNGITQATLLHALFIIMLIKEDGRALAGSGTNPVTSPDLIRTQPDCRFIRTVNEVE